MCVKRATFCFFNWTWFVPAQVIKMLVVVVLLFAFCWMPLHAFFMVADFFPDRMNKWRAYGDGVSFTYTFLAIHFLAMSSSFVNPLVYSFMSLNFRVTSS